jgi:zinc protease
MAQFIDPSTVQRTVLSNGLTALIRRDTSAPVVAIVTHVKAGYFDETDDVSGIAHVLEHMFFKGTSRRGVGEISKETKGSGGYLNAHTIYDQTVYFTVLPSSGFGNGIDIQSDAYANSVIDAGELAKELEVIIQEAKRKADNPSALAVETLYELLHDRHRMRRWRIGHEEGLRRLDRNAMLGFYRNFYQPSNTILSIVGDIDIDAALKKIEEHYGHLSNREPVRNPGPPEPDHDDLRYRELAGDITQTQLVMGWRTAHAMHEDTPALDFAGNILAAGRASRLYRALRERKLVSSISAYNYSPTELGVFVLHAETPPERIIDAAGGAWDQMRSLREDVIDPAEMERVRRIFDARWMRRFESVEGQATYLADWEALGDWKLGDEYYQRFMEVTPECVRNVAQRYLDPSRTGIVIYRPDSAPPVASSAVELVRTMESQSPAPIDRLIARDMTPARVKESQPRLETTEAGVHVFRTAGGIPILVRPKKGAAIAHFGVHGVGGARDESRVNSGITTLAMRASVKGTATRTATQIAEDSEMLGGSIGTSIGSEGFGWGISVPLQHIESAVGLVADVVYGATIPEDVFETERTVALADLETMRDDMFRYPMRLAMAAAYGDHPYALSPLGSDDSLKSLTAEQARQWYHSRLLSSPLVIGIVGDVVPEDAAALIAGHFAATHTGRIVAVPAPEWPQRELISVESREKAQTALALGFQGPSRIDARRYAAQLIATIASGLGGRFFDELRDRQSLAYTVHAYTSEHQLAGMFLSYIATSPEKEETARNGLLREFERLRAEPVTDDELARAKRYAIGSHAIRQESGGSVLAEMLDAFMYGSGLGEIERFNSAIEAVTADDILALAGEYFDPSRRVEGVVRGVGKRV